MPTINEQADHAESFLGVITPFALEIVGLVVVLAALNWLLKRREADNPERRTLRLVSIAVVGILSFVVILTQCENQRWARGDLAWYSTQCCHSSVIDYVYQ